MIVNRKPPPRTTAQKALSAVEWLVFSLCIAFIVFFLWLIISPFKYHACNDRATELHKFMYLTFGGECQLIDRDNNNEQQRNIG